MENNNWQLHRAGLFNFWYYDEEEFHFADGKLLLRGTNGSGKSVTMQSLLPILLDGRKSPDRLDPFGSKARKMEDYLLGEKDVVERDERTGYLYLEYKRQSTEQYLTTGIGLRAKRHSSMDFWGFVLLDNRRIDHDLKLYKTEYNVEDGQEQKIPLTRRELEHRLQEGGKLVRTQGEYMQLVNKHLFGFESLEAYEELIKLLIQLRSPKLSKDFKPTVIYEILNESLPALSDDELRPLSDTIENMDQTKQQLDQLKRDQQALARLCKHYDQYNRFVLAQKAEGFLKAQRKKEKLAKDREELNRNKDEYTQRLEQKQNDLNRLEREQQVLQQEERELKKHKVSEVEQEKQEVEQHLKATEANVLKKEQALDQKQRSERQIEERIKTEEEKVFRFRTRQNEVLDELGHLAEEAQFFQHESAVKQWEQASSREEAFDFILWKQEAEQYQESIERILSTLREQAKAKEAYDAAQRELGEATKALDLKRREQRKWEMLFEEEREKFLNDVHGWIQENRYLALSTEEIQHLSQHIVQLYDVYQVEDARGLVASFYQQRHGKLESDKLRLEHDLGLVREKTGATEEEQRKWKEMHDPEPDRHEDTQATRERLESEGIPFVPLFAAVEFQDHVPEEQRERLESAIAEAGLLDALIVPEREHSRLGKQDLHRYDRILQPNPQLFAHTLADVLEPLPPTGSAVTAADIDDILRSILMDGWDVGEGTQTTDGAVTADGSRSIEGTLTRIREDGSYAVGLVQGHAPRSEKSIYIGKEARKQYRLQQIALLEDQLQELYQQEEQLEEQIRHNEAQQQALKQEWQAFPTEQEVSEAYREVQNMHHQVLLHEDQVEKFNRKVKQTLEHYQSVRSAVQEQTEAFTLPANEEVYEQAGREMREYGSLLQQLELQYSHEQNSRGLISQYAVTLEDLQFDVDTLKGEVHILHDDLEQYRYRLERIATRLQELGADEIRRRIAQVLQRLEDIPEQLKELTVIITQTEGQLEQVHREIEEVQEQLSVHDHLCQCWQDVFIADDRLGFVEEVDPAEWSTYAAALQRAKNVWKTYGEQLRSANLDRDKVADRLKNAFFQEQAVLVEYRLTQEEHEPIDDLPQVEDNEILEHQVEQLRLTARRLNLILEYNGKRVSPYYVLEQISSDITLQEQLLSEKDRELYEEIIMNSVGRIIKGRINRAERWVQKMNQLMADRDNSSGLTFTIRWKPKTADIEEEMDTNELVELLRSDARLLKEEDMNQVIRHFRSKIERAKEILEEKGYGETLHQAIREILDYRQWFAFTLYYRKEGENRKELTNNVFYTFSGGEKAMAMYIPLFSAAYSRYSEAHADAPYIISLDEAFAGVDENNIRDMFDLVEKLGFNYIMNSQALWGDYDTVSSLSIAELVRPKNAPFVTVIRYYWDGHSRHFVHEGYGNEQEADREAQEQAGEEIFEHHEHSEHDDDQEHDVRKDEIFQS